jgi:hypothetical protein
VSRIKLFHLVLLAENSSGLDASISFETDRPENLGNVFSVVSGLPEISFVDATLLGVSLCPSLLGV